MAKDPKDKQVNNVESSGYGWCRLHQKAHEEETCQEFMLAMNMIQCKTQNANQSVKHNANTIDNSGDTCMFKLYTPTKDGELEEESYESTSRGTQLVLAF